MKYIKANQMAGLILVAGMLISLSAVLFISPVFPAYADGGGGDGIFYGEPSAPRTPSVTSTSLPNACGATTTKTENCTWGEGPGRSPVFRWSCSTPKQPPPPPEPANLGNACTSTPNSCGQTNTGTIQCNGSCSAKTPSNNSCPAVKCTPLSSQTRTQTCPSGQTGSITQERVSICRIGTDTPTWNPWITTESFCSTCAPSSSQTQIQTQTRTFSCPEGQIGSVTQERVSTCPAVGSSLTWNTWVITSNTCNNINFQTAINIAASPLLVSAGTTSRVGWNQSVDLERIESCTVESSDNASWSGTRGSEIVTIDQETTFNLTCIDEDGSSDTDSVTVRIAPNWQEF